MAVDMGCPSIHLSEHFKKRRLISLGLFTRNLALYNSISTSHHVYNLNDVIVIDLFIRPKFTSIKRQNIFLACTVPFRCEHDV